MCLRPIRSRPQDSEDTRGEASGGGVRRARKSNLLNDYATHLNEARQMDMATSDAMRRYLNDWCDNEDGVEAADKQAILCICYKTN